MAKGGMLQGTKITVKRSSQRLPKKRLKMFSIHEIGFSMFYFYLKDSPINILSFRRETGDFIQVLYKLCFDTQITKMIDLLLPIIKNV